MAYEVPALPYDYNALEPTIDEATMRLHHDKHHQAYVDKANAALAGTDLDGTAVEEALRNLAALPSDRQGAFRNNGGGHANHSLFWRVLAPAKGALPRGGLAKALERAFGSHASFEAKLKATALSVFGSGWVWLSRGPDGQLVLQPYANQDSPLSRHHRPVVGIDVWEHAYYLKYQNRRADYLDAILKVIDWDAASARFDEAGA